MVYLKKKYPYVLEHYKNYNKVIDYFSKLCIICWGENKAISQYSIITNRMLKAIYFYKDKQVFKFVYIKLYNK